MTIPSPIQLPKHRPLQVAVAQGMLVCEMGDGTPGDIVGITEAFCIYRLHDIETLCVANWREIAVSNICPASTLLATDVNENDRRNASRHATSRVTRTPTSRNINSSSAGNAEGIG